MKFWDYIKDKLFNKKKYLPEPKDNTVNITGINSKKQAFDEFLNVDIDIRPNTLDWAIDQYMLSLIAQENSGKGINPYNALIQLGAIRNYTTGYNQENQKIFLRNLNNGFYGNNTKIIDEQKDENGNEVFYHISNIPINEIEINYRMYLNCKKENVAILADRFAEELKEQDYYFKFTGNSYEFERSEQFVFYAKDEKDLQEKMMVIDKIKQENPKLFEGANCVNPFMKTVDGYLAYAPNLKNNEYVDLDGNTHFNSVASYNDLLSNALKDSFVHSAKEIALKGLNIDLSQCRDIYQILGSKSLEKIYQDNNLKMKFIESVKQKLKIASERNPELDIKGIEAKSKNPEKSILDNIPENY